MEFLHRSAPVDDGVELFRTYTDDDCLTHRQVHQLWATNSQFRSFYTDLFLEPGFDGFCWETPAVTSANLDEDHEFVVVKSTAHENIQANSGPFSEHFTDPSQLATAFPNLGKNGIMIAPYPDDSINGGSIASFLRTASANRIDALWALVGTTACSEIGSNPIWISTAGLGVSWLHVRFDSTPKYYRYQPYRKV